MILFLKKPLLCVFIVSLAILNCTYFRMVFKTITINVADELKPSQGNSKRTSPEGCIAVYGQVQSTDSMFHPLIVAAISYKFGKVEVVAYDQLYKPGFFSLYLPSGQYSLYVFSDINNNKVFENTECVGFYTDSPMLTVKENEEQRRIIGPITLTIEAEKIYKLDMPLSLKAERWGNGIESKYYPAGTIRSLDDPIFAPRNGILGIYEPAAFLKRAGGYLYALAELDTNKSPLIFVHGIGGTPRDFEYVAEKIDRSRYEPLFFYYPSGERLQMVADIFYEIILSQKVFDMKGRKVVICAHSMGGLVARAAINRYVQDGNQSFIKAFITLATPFGGNDNAASAVRQAPLVVPAWKDIAAGSSFMAQLYATNLPESIPFYLFFSYRSPRRFNVGENSDGTIDLKSQLFPAAQFSAKAIYGFDETHTGLLNDVGSVEKLNQILSGI